LIIRTQIRAGHAWPAVGIGIHTFFALFVAKKNTEIQKPKPFSLLIFILVKIRMGHAPDFVPPPPKSNQKEGPPKAIDTHFGPGFACWRVRDQDIGVSGQDTTHVDTSGEPSSIKKVFENDTIRCWKTHVQ